MTDSIWVINSYRESYDGYRSETIESTLTDEGWFATVEAAQAHIDAHLAVHEARRYDEYLARIRKGNAETKRAVTIANKELAAMQAAGLRKSQPKVEPRLTTPMEFQQWLCHTESTTYEPVEVTRAHRTHI